MTRKIYIVAGEASGDVHGASLVASLRERHPDWRFVGLGGERMRAAGVELRSNLVDRSVMGFRKVLAEMGYLFGVASVFLEELRREPPELLILIDYPGLNLNLARMARRQRVPVVYYVCPQVWAWAPWRIRRVARRADLLLVILPFEERLYRSVHDRVRYVGNPIFDHLVEQESTPVQPSSGPVLALFPGSRGHEVDEALPLMLRSVQPIAAARGDLAVVVSCHRPRLRGRVEAAIRESGMTVAIHEGDPHTLQRTAQVAVVVSGTATLELAFFGTPLVVVYPVRRWERRVFGWLSVTPFIALVNLFAGRALVPELLVAEGEEGQVEQAVRRLLLHEPAATVRRELHDLRERLFQPGASARAAAEICRVLEESPASPESPSVS
ncbi:MAG: lipid-A-disaccharide synthase [Planctomycetota bacterium]